MNRLLSPKLQIGIAVAICVSSIFLLVSALLRFVPVLDNFAIGKSEPFWVLLLSIAALLYAGFSALPAALAYKEAKQVNIDNAERVDIDIDAS